MRLNRVRKVDFHKVVKLDPDDRLITWQETTIRHQVDLMRISFRGLPTLRTTGARPWRR